MTTVPIRELRNHGGDVADRVLAGEQVTVTRAGKPVMKLVAVQRQPLSSAALIKRWQHVPRVQFDQLRADLATVIDDTA